MLNSCYSILQCDVTFDFVTLDEQCGSPGTIKDISHKEENVLNFHSDFSIKVTFDEAQG